MRLSLKKFKEPKQLLLSKETMIDINISPDGQYLVAANVTHFYVLSLANPAIGWANFKTPNAIRCIAVHPSQPTLAVGDSRGMIRLYRPFDHNWWQAKQKAHEESAQPAVTSLRPSFSSMHWHAFGVVSLAFTLNGAMLLSGGEEGVLVQWQLSNGAKDFLPRLGAPVSSIHCSPLSPDSPSEAAVALVDGSILLTSIPDKKVMRTISGLKSGSFRSLFPPMSMFGLMFECRRYHW